MFEETNQTEEMMLPDNLFTEEEDVLTEEGESPVEVSEEIDVAEQIAPDGTPAPAEVMEALRVKYNGEEKDIPLDEARVLAQKGMNYDKILGERDELTSLMDAYAKSAGLSRDQFIDFLKKNLANYEEGVDIENLRKSYPGASDDILRELATRDKKIREAEVKEREESDRKAEEEKRLEPWNKFYSRHKDVSFDNIDNEIFRLVEEEGYSPEEAYLKLENDKLKAGADVARQNQENLDRAIGSARGNGGKVKKDPFLEGFNG